MALPCLAWPCLTLLGIAWQPFSLRGANGIADVLARIAQAPSIGDGCVFVRVDEPLSILAVVLAFLLLLLLLLFSRSLSSMRVFSHTCIAPPFVPPMRVFIRPRISFLFSLPCGVCDDFVPPPTPPSPTV